MNCVNHLSGSSEFDWNLMKLIFTQGCALKYLPGLIGSGLTHIRVFNNTRLTHYPIVYEKFLRLHYDYWSENVVRYERHVHSIDQTLNWYRKSFHQFNCSADLLMIFLPDESKRTIIPRGIKKLSTPSDPRNPSSLYEYSLRSLYNNRHIYNFICRNLNNDLLPAEIFNHVQQGPVAVCGSDTCTTSLFTECHFTLLKK